MNDIINGCFELVAGLLLLLNIRALYKSKKVEGISIIPVTFFTVWGYWNLYFYPSVKAYYSYHAGFVVVFSNTIWLILWAYYKRKDSHE